MKKSLQSNIHFQYRLVDKLIGIEITTKKNLADIKEGENADHTSDLHATERSALQLASNYCRRRDKRKGLPTGEFLGVVVTKSESSQSFTKPVHTTIPKRFIKKKDWGRKRKLPGTTTWLYYIEILHRQQKIKR